MSFSSDVKSELCRHAVSKRCCAVAECYGALMYCNTFLPNEIKFVTASREFASRLPKLFKKAFNLEFDRIADGGEGGKGVLQITDREKLAKIYDAFGADIDKTPVHHVNYGVLEETCCKVSFIRGAFLAGGSVTDPEKRYHMEVVTGHYNVSRETYALLLELGFSPKETLRSGNYVLYFKKADEISELLSTIGATNAGMGILNAKIEKSMSNTVNRKLNCDFANADKVVAAAREQLAAIKKIEREIGIFELPEPLLQAAMLRMANPDSSLADLALLSDPKVTKSCLNHRMKKLVDMAAKLN